MVDVGYERDITDRVGGHGLRWYRLGTIGIGWSGRLPPPDPKGQHMAVESTGRAHWEGDLTSGSGTASLDTGAVGPMQVTWNARSEEHAGVTSPEELIAAAHAACFSMAFSARLGKAGGTSIVLDTEATATFVPGEGITGIVLSVKGSADGVSEADFMSLAEDAKENCPVSQALTRGVPISLDASMS